MGKKQKSGRKTRNSKNATNLVESSGTVLLEIQHNSYYNGKKKNNQYNISSPFTRFKKKISKIDLNHQTIIKLSEETVLFDEPTVFTYILGVLGEYEYPIKLKEQKVEFLQNPELLDFLFKTLLLIDDYLVILFALHVSLTDDEDEIQNLTEFIRYIYLNKDDVDLTEDLTRLDNQFYEALTEPSSDILDYLINNYEVISKYEIKNRFEVNSSKVLTQGKFLDSMVDMGLINTPDQTDEEKEEQQAIMEKYIDETIKPGDLLFPLGSKPYYYLIKNQNNDIFQVFQFNDEYYLLNDEELLEWVRYSNPNLILNMKRIKVVPKKRKKKIKQKFGVTGKKKKIKSEVSKKIRREKPLSQIQSISVKTPKLKHKKDVKNLVFHEFSGIVKKYEKKMEKKRWKKQEKRGDKITTFERIRVCLVHKGKIKGLTYVCPSCGSLYCYNCIKSLNKKKEKCWNCKSEIVL